MQEYPKMLYHKGKLDGTAPCFPPRSNVYCASAMDAAEEAAMLEKYGFHRTFGEAESYQTPEEPPAEQPKKRGRPPKTQ